MTQTLLVGTDCSECSKRAVDYAATWAKLANLHLYVAHVIQWSPYTFNTPRENEERHKRREDELERAHALIIDPIVTDLLSKGVDAEGVVRHGHPAETLHALGNELGVSNIIIGRKGESPIKAKLFGSVAGTLVQISDHPVTVVP
jgi:nucleotide-binding universal stress UspA family protein